MQEGVGTINTRSAKHEVQLEEWEKRIQECVASGQTVQAWCTEQGLCVTTYYRWKRELQSRKKNCESVCVGIRNQKEWANGFIEITQKCKRHSTGQTGVLAEIRTGQIEVIIYAGTSPEQIQALCEVVKC